MNLMNKVLATALVLLAFPAIGQVTTAKPASPSFNTGVTHFPEHLWMMNEGSGTTLEDDGDGGDYDLTCNAPDWGTDGTHGDMLTFVAANSDGCINTSVGSLSGTQTACAVLKLTAGTGARNIMSWDQTTSGNFRSRMVYQGDEDIETQSENTGTLLNNTSTQDGTGGWDMVCIRWSDTTSDWSLNGAAWVTATGTLTGLSAAINGFALGLDNDSSPSGYFNNPMIAAWWWKNTSKSSAEIATVYNSGNPWPIIGAVTSAAPTFTTGPTAGSPTATTIPTTFTLDQNGTVFGVMCPDGQTLPTVTQVLAGNCTGNVAAASAWTETGVVAGVGDNHTFTGLTASTTYDGAYAATATGGNSAAISTTPNITTSATGGPMYDSGPSVMSQTAAAYTISYDTNSVADTIFCGVYLRNATAPTGAQVEAGTNAHGTANEASTHAADTITLTSLDADRLPVYDLYCVLKDNPSTYSTVSSMLNQALTAPIGRQYVTKSGAPTGGQYGILDNASPAAVDGDIMDAPLCTDSFDDDLAAHTFTLNADTTYTVDIEHDCSGASVSADLSRQSIARRFYDVSVQAWSDATRVLYYANNKAPQYLGPDEVEPVPFLFEKNATLNEALDAVWDDAEGDPLTHAVTNMPAGGTLTGSETITGAFTTLGYYPTVSLKATDIATDFTSQTVQFVVGAKLPPIALWLQDEDRWDTHNIFQAEDSFNVLRRAMM